DPEFRVALAGAHRQQLGDRGGRHRVATGQRQQGRPHVEQLGGLAFGDQPASMVLPDLVELAVPDELNESVQVGQEGRLAAADRHPLGGERSAADLPAAVDLTEHQLVWNQYVVDEDGVEHRVSGQLAQRLDLHTLAAHIEQEVGDAVVFWSGRVRPCQQHAPMRYLRCGGPDLLTGDAPTTVDLGGLGGEACQVRTGARLGKQLAPDHFAAERWRQEALLLLFGAERDDRRYQPRRDAHRGSAHLASGEFLGDDDLLDRARCATPWLGQGGHPPAAFGDRDIALL